MISSLSVCIATHERPALLAQTLNALAAQIRLPDEIVVSDSSVTGNVETVVRSFAEVTPHPPVRYVKSDQKALPWNRWLAFTHTSAERVLFLDDDVRLSPMALKILEETWKNLPEEVQQPIAGIGFTMTWEDGQRLIRQRNTFAERWLGTSRVKSGSVTAGGLSVSIDDLRSSRPIKVDQLWGGAMSFQQKVLASVGLLDRLAALYEAGVGRGEDVVLSKYAREHGALYLITQPLAFHPYYNGAKQPAPYATAGWRLGMTATWGRAHTLRWLASDWSAYKRSWARLASLEVARSILGIVRQPVSHSSWKRLAGSCYGVLRTITRWNQIPATATSTHDSEGRK